MNVGNSVNYGGYGGVVNRAHYTPPRVPDITLTSTENVKPQYTPASVANITLTGTETIKPPYVPAPIAAFTPSPATAILTKQDREVLQINLNNTASNISSLLPSITSDALLRYLQNVDANNEKTFAMYTSSQPSDKITYTSYTPNVDVDINDGGYF